MATLSTSTLALGSHTITALYNGNANVLASSGTLAQTVSKKATATVLTASVSGQSVTFAVAVSVAAPGTGVPTGQVTFKAGSTTLGTRTLNGSGKATLAIAAASVAGKTVTATYAGGTNFAGSSASLTRTAAHTATTTVVVASADPSVVGQSVTFTATVSATSGKPTGSVTFKDGSTTLGTRTLNASGKATFIASSLALGSHTITVSYAGTSTFSASSRSLTQIVCTAPTSTVVVASADPAVSGQTVTFTATVSAAVAGVGAPAGSVTFKDGSTTLGTGTLSGGKAVFTTSALTPGSHTITASYAATSKFAASSNSLTEAITAALMVDTAAAPKGSPQLVTEPQLVSMLAAAEQRWAAAAGVQVLAALSGVTVQVADLPSGMLGEEVGKTILIDRDAAGYGWFVDPTPTKDEEFTPGNQQLRAIDPRAVDRIDLLTVVEHELGHVLGLKDLSTSTDDLMSGVLGIGIRRDPSHQDAVDAVLAS